MGEECNSLSSTDGDLVCHGINVEETVGACKKDVSKEMNMEAESGFKEDLGVVEDIDTFGKSFDEMRKQAVNHFVISFKQFVRANRLKRWKWDEVVVISDDEVQTFLSVETADPDELDATSDELSVEDGCVGVDSAELPILPDEHLLIDAPVYFHCFPEDVVNMNPFSNKFMFDLLATAAALKSNNSVSTHTSHSTENEPNEKVFHSECKTASNCETSVGEKFNEHYVNLMDGESFEGGDQLEEHRQPKKLKMLLIDEASDEDDAAE